MRCAALAYALLTLLGVFATTLNLLVWAIAMRGMVRVPFPLWTWCGQVFILDNENFVSYYTSAYPCFPQELAEMAIMSNACGKAPLNKQRISLAVKTNIKKEQRKNWQRVRQKARNTPVFHSQ